MVELPKGVYAFYGKRFMEAYEAAGGALIPTTYIHDRLGRLAAVAGTAAAQPEPTPNKCGEQMAMCRCHEFADGFVGSAISFKCPVHGDITIDRRCPPMSSMSINPAQYIGPDSFRLPGGR
jgi:hypothetical protein